MAQKALGAALIVADSPSLALAKNARRLGSPIDPVMFAPEVMAALLALLIGSLVAQSRKYGPAAPWLAGLGVLATIALSSALVDFGPFVTPIPQVVILAFVLRRLRRRPVAK